jgi:hypothetical protein
MSTHTSLNQKLVHLLGECDTLIKQGVSPNFGMLRHLLGTQRILILPHIKSQHEVAVPGTSPEQARATVIVEISLVDAEHAEQITSRWIGQAQDAPMIATEKAITHAMEDFLQKTFLVIDDSELTAQLPQGSQIRRRPQGAPPTSTQVTTPASAPDPVTTTAHTSPPPAQQAQLDLLDLPPTPAANEDAPSDPLPPLTKEWKSANALWRALVNEVASAEVMDAFEDAIEREHAVDSWRRLPPAQIRSVCQQLKKRSALPPDIRKMSDREEYILSKLPLIPEGSSLNRLSAELHRLSIAVVSARAHEAFLALYLEKMNAEQLSEVPGKAVIALARKMRRLKPEPRETFILQALADAERDHTTAA